MNSLHFFKLLLNYYPTTDSNSSKVNAENIKKLVFISLIKHIALNCPIAKLVWLRVDFHF